MIVPALAAEDAAPLLVDNADLLSPSEQLSLIEKLEEVSYRQKMDIVIVTTNTLDGKSPMAYADDFYDDNGYGYGSHFDGILLLISMEDNDWWISTTGYGITAFTDAGIEYISQQFLSDLSDGNYAEAFTVYAEQCDAFITQARTGDPYDSHNLPKAPFAVFFNLIIALIIGFVIALIATAVMRSKLKSVRAKPAAADYVKSGSLSITESREIFLYRNVTRRAKPKQSSDSSSHRSSSGRSHGGGGGKF